MSALRELYQELIIDHSRHPRNFGELKDPTHSQEGYNPLCGDRLTVYLRIDKNKIIALRFRGEGCAISIASASLMTEALLGKTIDEACILFKHFHLLATNTNNKIHQDTSDEILGKLKALGGVSQFPARVKCATLGWHTLQAALEIQNKIVTTE